MKSRHHIINRENVRSEDKSMVSTPVITVAVSATLLFRFQMDESIHNPLNWSEEGQPFDSQNNQIHKISKVC